MTVHINGEDIWPAIRDNVGWLTSNELSGASRISFRGNDDGREDENRHLYLAGSISGGKPIEIKRRTARQTEDEDEERRRFLSLIGDPQSTVDDLDDLRMFSDSKRVGPTLMSLSDWRFEAMLANGLALTSKLKSRPESYAGDSATFTVDHQDENGIAHLRSKMRLQFYPDQTFVKLHHRLEVISPALAPAQGGDLPADCSADMRENIVGEGGEESTLLKLRSFSLHIPFAGIKSLRHGGENWRVGGWGGKTWGLRHDHDLAHSINGDERDGRANGHIRV